MLVYKYRGGNEDIFQRDLNAIESNYFWASNFETLNDPCENVVISDKFLKQTKGLGFLLGKRRNEALNELHSALENLLSVNKKIGIYSLSKSYLDELLWAHYSNSHKGFCIEYDLDILLSSFKTEKVYPFPVIYGNNPPEISLADIPVKNDSIIYKMTAYKSKRWEYEQEYRIITDYFGKQSYDYKALKAIYFGLRIDENQKKEVMKRLCDRDVKFYQLELLEKSYIFKAVELKNTFIPEVQYLTSIPASITGSKKIRFTIVDQMFYKLVSKGTITIELETTATESDIKWLANKIKNQVFHTAERIYIFYNLKGIELDVAWATSHFEKEKLEITFNDWALS